MITIETNQLRVEVDENGGQISSIYHKEFELEYLWQKDQSYWASSAPVVFPVIGKLNDLTMKYKGQNYEIKSNGLIRYSKLSIVRAEQNFVELLFKNEGENLKRYPFPCSVLLTYKVISNKLFVSATITNESEEDMHYFYAGHPGFNVPLFTDESCNDYYVEFEGKETLDIYDVCETGQLIDKKIPFFENENRFFVRKDLFLKEALVFCHPKSKSVSIKSLNHEHEVKVNFDEFDNLAIWSPYIKEKDLKFICIEPWIGHTEFKGFSGEWNSHDEIACLKPRKSRQHMYSIELI